MHYHLMCWFFLCNQILLTSQFLKMNRWYCFTSFTYLIYPIWIDIIITSIDKNAHLIFPCWKTGGVTEKFFWGGKLIFPDFFHGVKCFFPVENFHFGSPKTNLSGFEKWEAKKKKKKKKKKVLSSFCNFSTFHFQFSTFPFTIFLLFFSIFTPSHFFLASFFPVGQQKFPNQKSLGELCPLPFPLLCHCWKKQKLFFI